MKKSGSKFLTLEVGIIVVVIIIDIGGNPGGGLGGPGGGLNGNRSSGTPLLLLRLKKPSPGPPKQPKTTKQTIQADH